MKEIKFRAWDVENERWLPINEIVNDWGSTPWIDAMYTADTEFGLHDSGNTLVWQQYTGLKDKNGKEIYEGDILRGTASDDSREYTKNGCVVFKEHELRYELDEDFCLPLNWYESLEVIGNIYENPELLQS